MAAMSSSKPTASAPNAKILRPARLGTTGIGARVVLAHSSLKTDMKYKNQHEWSFMASPGSNGAGELAHCSLCNRWRFSKEPKLYFKMSQEQYETMHKLGQIDASASLGPVK